MYQGRTGITKLLMQQLHRLSSPTLAGVAVGQSPGTNPGNQASWSCRFPATLVLANAVASCITEPTRRKAWQYKQCLERLEQGLLLNSRKLQACPAERADQVISPSQNALAVHGWRRGCHSKQAASAVANHSVISRISNVAGVACHANTLQCEQSNRALLCCPGLLEAG